MCAEPDIKPPVNDKDYVEHWMRQSELFWSRLQSATVLHSGVLIAWYQIHPSDKLLRLGVLLVGIIISLFLIGIMRRDAVYLDKIKDICGFCFPDCGKGLARLYAYLIVWTLIAVEIILIGVIVLPCLTS